MTSILLNHIARIASDFLQLAAKQNMRISRFYNLDMKPCWS